MSSYLYTGAPIYTIAIVGIFLGGGGGGGGGGGVKFLWMLGFVVIRGKFVS